MGKNTKNYRQTRSSMAGNRGAQAYASVQRGTWHQRVWNYLKVRGKNNNNI